MTSLASRANPINKTQSISGLGAEAGEVEELEKNPSVPMGTLKPQLKQRDENRRSRWMWETFPRQRWPWRTYEWLPQCVWLRWGTHCWHRWSGRGQAKAPAPRGSCQKVVETGLSWQTWAEEESHWITKGGA